MTRIPGRPRAIFDCNTIIQAMAYDEVRSISPNMTPARTSAFVERIAFRATLIRRIPHVMDYPRDPKDEPHIDLAVRAKADYLVTRDKDLLSLMTGHTAVCKQFRHLTRPLRVLDPVSFLNAIGHRIPQ